jgi:pimeloyl-ACP methyl ester carboxylesterase
MAPGVGQFVVDRPPVALFAERKRTLREDGMKRAATISALAIGLALAAAGGAQALEIAKQGYLYAGGHYMDTPNGRMMVGQAYVEYQIPKNERHPYPIVMIEGGGQNGSNFTGTPDGRPGWAQYFLEQGYAVYVVDQPGRGRSAYAEDAYGPLGRNSVERIQQQFTAPERYMKWPQAKLHTQWPGSGVQGDAAFDQFYAEQMPAIRSFPKQQELNRDAGAALLDMIGPAILLTHSQSGAFGWPIADARPNLVRAILAVEPSGPPVYDADYQGAPTWFKDGPMTKPYGLSAVPLHYDPPVNDPKTDLTFVQQQQSEGPDLMRCWRQQEPARKLVNLQHVPILIISSEASYHAPYDHCTVEYLRQAGVNPTHQHLADLGIRGNGHMMMLEKNNLRIAAVMNSWLQKTFGPTPAHKTVKSTSK